MSYARPSEDSQRVPIRLAMFERDNAKQLLTAVQRIDGTFLATRHARTFVAAKHECFDRLLAYLFARDIE
jgi:hypothetical protein